jgi:hypothetical protein
MGQGAYSSIGIGSNDRTAGIGRAVVDDEKLKVMKILSEYAVDGLAEVTFAVVN